MKVKDALVMGVERLREAKIEETRLEAEVLLMHLLGISRAQLYIQLNFELPHHICDGYQALIARRLGAEPMAYITGHKEFYGLDLLVDPRVLIPRPETELLVELALGYIKDRGLECSPCVIADIGTGSGAVAIALAVQLPQARVYATDISSEALEVASANCFRHRVQDRVILLQGDLLKPLSEAVDLIVSNPPYITSAEWGCLAPEIKDHEPTIALHCGADGLAIVKRLLPDARGTLKPGGALFVEVGYDSDGRVLELARAIYPDARLGIEPDLSSIGRALTIYTRDARAKTRSMVM